MVFKRKEWKTKQIDGNGNLIGSDLDGKKGVGVKADPRDPRDPDGFRVVRWIVQRGLSDVS